MVVPRHIKKKKAYFWLPSVATFKFKNSLLTSNVRTVNYGDHRSEIAIDFDLYEGHRGVSFE